MASPSKKPRDIKNLKARLGRTITPGQGGLPQGPGGIPGPAIGGSVPPPSIGRAPAPGAGSVPPPTAQPGALPGARPASPLSGPAAPGLGQPVGPAGPQAAGAAGAPAAGGLPGAAPTAPGAGPAATNPLGAPAGTNPLGAPAAAPAAAPGAAPAGAANPLGAPAAAPAGAEKKVTLVIDDSAVDEGEIGRKSGMRTVVLAVIGAVVGATVGWGIGSTSMERNQYNMALADGKDIYAKIQESSKTLDTVKKQVKAAMAASQSGPGKTAQVNYDAVKALVALERPFTANEFHRRRYRAFPPGVVDDLFDYYNNLNKMWDLFSRLGAKTAGKKKQALDESAKAADGLIKTQYGTVLTKQGNAFTAGLVFVEIPPPDPAAAADKKKKKEGAEPIVKVSSNQGGRSVDRKVFMGNGDLAADYNNYVIMLDKVRSRAILGESANLFGQYQALLMEVNALVTKTAEAQGRLLTELGKVASLPQQGMF